MNQEHIAHFCEDLNVYLKAMFNYKRNRIHCSINANICTNTKKFDIYLRWNGVYFSNKFPKNITIARIEFYKERKGYGQSFLKFLFECSLKYNFDYIVIEATNIKSSSFAQKFGFKKVDDEGGRNFVITTCDLKKILNYA